MNKTSIKLGLIASSLLLFYACGSAPKKETSTVNLEYMDQNVSPKDDFFQFSNGKWIAENLIPASESRWGSFNELDQENKRKLTVILELAAKNQGAQGSQNQILGAYYSSFMNMEMRNKQGVRGIETERNLIRGLKSKDQLVEVIASLHKDGLGPLFNFGVSQDLKQVDKHISYLGQGGLGLPNKDYYTKENKKDVLAAYKKHVAAVFKLSGRSEEESAKGAEHVLQIENALAQACLAPAEMRQPEKTYNKKSLSETAKLFGTFDFNYYLNKVGATRPDSIIVAVPDFVSTCAKLIESESLTVWKDYLEWNLLNHYAGHLGEDFVNLNFEFYGKTLSGKKERKPLNESAIDEITNMEFGELLGKAFVDKYFSVAAKNKVNEMVDNLLAVFKERINNLEWMTPTTKKEAIIKLTAIGRKLGYPDKWEDFSMLKFKSDDYLANYKEISRYSTAKNFKELNQPVDKTKWGMPAHMVNAYYHPLLNEIAFPAGIMQAPFFDENAEDAVNYGRIGMVIGHEFTHGFDDMGSKFAADGSFKNWWTEEDRKLFEEKTQILGETFSAFCPIEGHCVNPDLTMGENIADLGGLTMAYYAYRLTAEYKRQEKRNGFTPEQRFFIAYAQLWKIKYTDQEMKNRIATDPHSPGMYRVNGPLKNCPEFFEAFDVKEGDKMRNTSKKVARIW